MFRNDSRRTLLCRIQRRRRMGGGGGESFTPINQPPVKLMLRLFTRFSAPPSGRIFLLIGSPGVPGLRQACRASLRDLPVCRSSLRAPQACQASGHSAHMASSTLTATNGNPSMLANSQDTSMPVLLREMAWEVRSAVPWDPSGSLDCSTNGWDKGGIPTCSSMGPVYMDPSRQCHGTKVGSL